MKSSRAEIYSRISKIPNLQFEDNKLTSFSGAILFQILFNRLQLKSRLKNCFSHLKQSAIFRSHWIVLLLILHILLGYRRLRELKYYDDDPLLLRVLGLRKLPDVATVSRTLSHLDQKSVDNVRGLSRSLVLEGLKRLDLPRVTLDFDGSVQSTKGHREGTAIGFNPKKKGARSYYPLYGTVAQTSQFFDMYHRPGNVHDSHGASDFMKECIQEVRNELPRTLLESRIDSAFFNQNILDLLNQEQVQFTASVPFERFPDLKEIIESRNQWHTIDDEWSYFELNWKPDSWKTSFRFICIRKRFQQRIKGPLQLDFFEPLDFEYEYKVIVTNKSESAKSILLFHNGRGSQEGLFAEAKQHASLDVLPSRRLHGNQMFTVCSMMAHNLSRTMQMVSAPPSTRTLPKRPPLWNFLTLGTLRHRIIQRAGRMIRPRGELTLVMSANPTVRKDILHFMESLQKEAA